MLIHNANIITFDPQNRLIGQGAILIRNGLIEEIGSDSLLKKKYGEEEKYDARQRFILPGMIIPHFHIYSALARGLFVAGDPPENFLQILQRFWWRLDKKLTPEDIRHSAYVALLDCIKSGTTTLIDHHASPGSVMGSLDILAEVFAEFGLRGCLSYEVSDRDGEKIARAGIAENIRFAEKCARQPSPSMAPLFGLHASFTLSDNTLMACREAADGLNLGFHFHLAEGKTDRRETERKYGYRSPVQRLKKLGILRDHSIAAHAIDVDEKERRILKEYGVTMVHNPQSNMNNGVGFADVTKMIDAGLLVGLGTDGMTANLFREIQTAALLPKHENRNPGAGGNWLQKIVTGNHARIASTIFKTNLGRLQPGACADLIIIKYDPPTPLHGDNFWQHLLFGLANSPVESTMAGGKFLMKNGEILVCDEEKILADAREQAKKLWAHL